MAPRLDRQIEILMVEDNPGDARLTLEAFKEGNVKTKVHVARDGVEALDFVRRVGAFSDAPRPDLILLDLNLPRKNGRDVLAEIKAEFDLRTIPVVILTTSEAKEDIDACYALCASCYVTKPVNFDEFMALIRLVDAFWLNAVTLPTMVE